jgi:hypothetical protein
MLFAITLVCLKFMSDKLECFPTSEIMLQGQEKIIKITQNFFLQASPLQLEKFCKAQCPKTYFFLYFK